MDANNVPNYPRSSNPEDAVGTPAVMDILERVQNLRNEEDSET